VSLAGKRVLVLRAEGQAEQAVELLRKHGAEAVVIPSIVIGPPDDERALRAALGPERLARTDWVVFTSANGVIHTWRALAEQGRGGAGDRPFGSTRFAVVGTATEAALVAHGERADVVAKEFRGEGVAAALLERLKGTGAATRPGRVLILRAQEASDVLPAALIDAGATVDVVAAYRTRPSVEGAVEIQRQLEGGLLDVVVFSSGSTIGAICDAMDGAGGADGPPPGRANALLSRVTVVSLGPVTAAAAAERGLRVDLVPSVATFAAAIEALEIHFRAI